MSAATPRKSQNDDSLNWMADFPVVFMAVGIFVMMIGIFAQRISHPYDLEWMEGGMLLHGYRVQAGEGLYVIPSSEFIPFIYTPLYSWLLGLGGKIFGMSYALGRGLSVLGSLAGAAALVAAVRGEKGSSALGLGTAALFLTTWDESGTFMDLVRTDGVLIGLLGWALVSIRHGWIRTGGMLLVLAFMAKHSVAIFGLPGIIWIGHRWGWTGVKRFLFWCFLPAMAFLEWMVLEGDGLFLCYILEAPSTHPFVYERFYPGTPTELYEALPWTTRATGAVTIFALGAVVYGWTLRKKWTVWAPGFVRHWPTRMGPGIYWGSQAALILLMCMVMRGHHGGYLNVLMPGHWMLAALAGMTLAGLQRWLPWIPIRLGVAVLLCGQLWQGSQWTKNGKLTSVDVWIPTEGDVVGGDAVVAQVSDIPGPVLAPWYPWIPVQSGKRPYFHLIALWDIMHEGSPLRPYGRAVREDIKSQRWQAILGISPSKSLRYGVDERYRSAIRLPRDQRISLSPPREAGVMAMKTRTGWPVRPQSVMVRKVRNWKLELPSTVRSEFDMAALREGWQGSWLVSTKAGPMEVWKVEKKTLTVFARGKKAEVVKKRTSRFDVVSPCAFGTSTLKDGSLPSYRIQGFTRVDEDHLQVGDSGAHPQDGQVAVCMKSRLVLVPGQDSSRDCRAWSGSSDHLTGAYQFELEETTSCTLETQGQASGFFYEGVQFQTLEMDKPANVVIRSSETQLPYQLTRQESLKIAKENLLKKR